MIQPLLPGVSLDEGPADWRIFQRDDRDGVDVPLAGSFLTACKVFRVEVRAVLENDGSLPPGAKDWQTAALLPDGRWTRTLRLPAGGLYRIETRLWRGDGPDLRPMRGDYVHHVGVGDLWVIAGQSNASGTGTGAAEDPLELGVHQLGADEAWKLAAHPLEDATRSRHPAPVHGVFMAHSPWIAFAKKLKARLGVPIGLIPTAKGGSAIAAWQPGEPLFENLVDLVTLAGGRVRGVAWHQGESDAFGGKAAAYPEAFRRMVKGLRERLGLPALPFVTGQLGTYADARTHEMHEAFTAMREHQRVLARELGHDVTPILDLPLGDEIHLTATSNLVMGRRYAETALASVYGEPVRSPGIALEAVRLVKGVPARIRIDVDLGGAGWVRVGSAEGDFSVEDDAGRVGVTACRADDEGFLELTLDRETKGPVRVTAHPGARPPVALRDRDQRPLTAFRVVATD